MEGLDLMAFANAFQDARVLITGHTGFKGAWLTAWLLQLGAKVKGLSLPVTPKDNPLFTGLELSSKIDHVSVDVREFEPLRRAIQDFQPQYVFHLAAQSLVRTSYREPRETYATNVMGTVNLLEALRLAQTEPCSVVIVTTDKCYENREWVHSYRETDPLGGHDPYSSSKGAAEIVAHGYRQSFFHQNDSPVFLATARAGNVIGGGDWATDRIVPDCIRALQQSQPIGVRNKVATRPWQHVLEPLSGYLWLAVALAGRGSLPFPSTTYRSAFNFGPHLTSNRTVAELVQEILKHWPGNWRDDSDPDAPHEATLLNLATDKAHHFLKWRSIWNFEKTVAHTIDWYRQANQKQASPSSVTDSQIAQYTSDAANTSVPWAIAEQVAK